MTTEQTMTITVEIDTYGYQGLSFELNIDATVNNEQDAILEYLTREFPDANVIIYKVSNGHGTNCRIEGSDDDFAMEEEIDLELEVLIGSESENWYVYSAMGDNYGN